MSVYLKSLSPEVQARYLSKISLINDVDPYDCEESTFSRDINLYPKIDAGDIRNYFVDTVSVYTHNEFKAYKSLDSYNYFKCGWVRDIRIRRFGDYTLILGKVMHSQRLREKCLKPWSIVRQENGDIISGHCDCIAGLGESCSHLGAMLYAVADQVHYAHPVSVTDVPAYWAVPRKVAEPAAWHDVLMKHRELNVRKQRPFSNQTPELLDTMLTKIKTSGITCALTCNTAPYCFQPPAEILVENRLTTLYSKENESLTLEELREKGSHVNLTLTSDECQKIEDETRGQSDNNLWFEHRTGRITASRFKSVCRTNVEKPAVSTIKAICYPKAARFTSKYTAYGCKHEKDALQEYLTMVGDLHERLEFETVGLILSTKYPYFGASPDGLVSCDCCGFGCVEVKCPYCLKDTSEKDRRPSYLKKGYLDESHAYYYQVQMQMAVCSKEYCDFVVWSPTELFVERIAFNDEFWAEESCKALIFWEKVVVAELLGKYYTRSGVADKSPVADAANQPQVATVSAITQSDEPQPCTSAQTPTQLLWCCCDMPDDGTPMIKCKNESCTIQWYHIRCLNMKRMPKIWFCAYCRNLGYTARGYKGK